MSFNNDEYIQGQIDKQYRRPKASSVKITLDDELYEMDDTLKEKILSSDVETIQKMVREGVATYQDIVMCYWNQVLSLKDYNAVITLNPKVIEQAKTMSYDMPIMWKVKQTTVFILKHPLFAFTNFVLFLAIHYILYTVSLILFVLFGTTLTVYATYYLFIRKLDKLKARTT